MKQLLSLLASLLVTGGVITARASGPETRAARDFTKREGERTEAKWSKIKDGFVAEFSQNESAVMDFYDQRGYWHFSVRTYGENRLPENIRRLVRGTYFEYSISWVKQVNGVEGYSYVVHIENPAAWKEVIVRDGEMTVWKAFDKIAPDRALRARRKVAATGGNIVVFDVILPDEPERKSVGSDERRYR